MNQLERQEKGLPYIADGTVSERQKQARRLSQQLNTIFWPATFSTWESASGQVLCDYDPTAEPAVPETRADWKE